MDEHALFSVKKTQEPVLFQIVSADTTDLTLLWTAVMPFGGFKGFHPIISHVLIAVIWF